MLPPDLAPLTYTDSITGATHQPVTSPSGSWLFVGQVLDILPVALLMGNR